jgi:hypothetical protein
MLDAVIATTCQPSAARASSALERAEMLVGPGTSRAHEHLELVP